MKNHAQNMAENLVPDPLQKNQNWAYLWINDLKFYSASIYCIPSWGLSKYIETKLQTTCFFFKKKQKEVWNESPGVIFCMALEEKHLSCYIPLTEQISLSVCLYLVRYSAISVLQLFVNQVVTSLSLKLTWSF